MLIKNIRIIDDSIDFFGDLSIENGVIVDIGTHLQGAGEVYDYKNYDWVLMPAFTDLHAHFRDPGLTYKEDLESGSRAASNGGYTAVNLMPNTKPTCSSLEMARLNELKVQSYGLITANQTISMTQNLQGKDCSHLYSLPKGEVLFVTDDGKGVDDDVIMEEIMKICIEKEITIMSHTEMSCYSATDMRLAENAMTFRDIKLCAKMNGRLHLCHVSTKEAIAAIIAAKKEGVSVTCEVTPHHIFSTGEAANHYRVNPPLREQADIDALIDAMKMGFVDAIATDHAPHSAEDKLNGSPGMTGLEIAFPLCFTRLVMENHLSLNQLVKLMSTNPSALLKLNKGSIKVGMNADFAIADIHHPFVIQSHLFKSKGKNTPFDGYKVYGQIMHTFFRGKRVK